MPAGPLGREADCARPFRDRGIEAQVIGTLDDSGVIAVASGGRSAVVVDLNMTPVTGLAPLPPPAVSGSG